METREMDLRVAKVCIGCTRRVFAVDEFNQCRGCQIGSLLPPYRETFMAVRNGARTLGEVAEATGARRMTAYSRLLRLAEMGMVQWDRRKDATIREKRL